MWAPAELNTVTLTLPLSRIKQTKKNNNKRDTVSGTGGPTWPVPKGSAANGEGLQAPLTSTKPLHPATPAQ